MLKNGKVLPSMEAVLPDLTNEQLWAELDRIQKLWQSDYLDWRQVLEEANQQLVEEETARLGEARE